MDNSDIEKMWKKGFQHQKVNINQEQMNKIMKGKSKNLVGRIKTTAKIDHYSTPILAALILTPTFYFEYYVLGTVIALVLLGLFIQNSIMLKKLDKVEFKDSTLIYLTEFRAFINYMKRYYTRLLAVGAPFLTVPAFLLGFQLSGASYENLWFSENMAVNAGLVVVYLIFSGLAAICFYHLGTKVLYGKKLRKLNEMIADLEAGTGIQQTGIQ